MCISHNTLENLHFRIQFGLILLKFQIPSPSGVQVEQLQAVAIANRAPAGWKSVWERQASLGVVASCARALPIAWRAQLGTNLYEEDDR